MDSTIFMTIIYISIVLFLYGIFINNKLFLYLSLCILIFYLYGYIYLITHNIDTDKYIYYNILHNNSLQINENVKKIIHILYKILMCRLEFKLLIYLYKQLVLYNIN